MQGWIKINRRIMKNEIWMDAEPFDRRSAWIDLLMLANHKDQKIIYKGKIITVKRGDVNRSLVQLSERWNWSRNKVRRYLDMLESAGMVTRNSTTDGTTITIEKYTLYQDRRTSNKTSNETTDETTDETRGETTDETRGGHIQECKELKNDKNDKKDIYKQQLQQSTLYGGGEKRFLSDYLTDDDWGKLRTEYENVLGLIDMVDEIACNPEAIQYPLNYISGIARNKNWPKKARNVT